MNFFNNLLELSLVAAPWLILGLIIGGAMKALIPTAFLHRHLSGDGLSSVFKASLLGAPLPLCSCGVIPAALGLRKSGASKPATAAFLVSTPETGVDSISVTYAMMGPFMAVVRPVSALFSAITAGLLVAGFDRGENTETTANATSGSGTSCCSSKTVTPEAGPDKNSCCSNQKTAKPEIQSQALPDWLIRSGEGVHYAFRKLLSDIALWLAIGLLFAAAVKTFIPTDFLVQWGQGIFAMLIMVLVGIPMYICATASTPLATGLIMAGMSPGVALVLLLTGPATNISTLGVIAKELGQRSLWLYLTAVVVTALGAGLVVDQLIVWWNIDLSLHLHGDHRGFPLWLEAGSLGLLVLCYFRFNYSSWLNKPIEA